MSQEMFNKFLNDKDEKELLELATAAENAERYKDMSKTMKKLVLMRCDKGESLSVEERNLLSVAYKNVVGNMRAAWRNLAAPNDDKKPEFKEMSKRYVGVVGREVGVVCNEVLILLETLVDVVKKEAEEVGTTNDKKLGEIKEAEVFYLKMSGDYWRYMAEIFVDDKDNKVKTEMFYKDAMKVAKENLAETHPTRLGLALNFSVCYYEILDNKEKACELAKEAFDAAIEKLDTLNDASYKDSTLIMQLLRDNLTLWTSEEPAPDKEVQQS